MNNILFIKINDELINVKKIKYINKSKNLLKIYFTCCDEAFLFYECENIEEEYNKLINILIHHEQ